MVELLIIIAVGIGIYGLGFLSGLTAGVCKTWPYAKQHGHSEGYQSGLTANVEKIILTKVAGGMVNAQVTCITTKHTPQTASEWPDEVDA